ncbi:hypothetical protein TanjilG_12042 [Lupinus angustifolius]|uniref:Pentacotripeptide-repeat region of PRORP domain-containing protein n=1 Tax=Lupinus angustifolius TaxID=3871 RepID=A0A1J7HY21_LUPAN|nr:PREDICTED: pentatricopeptide repeat-containing protein At5g15980, mitochondrial-like [Lupinus angustifolius]OIW05451.1 hypothetical protein TanjilG_12042 [Lupinus angustifolius]
MRQQQWRLLYLLRKTTTNHVLFNPNLHSNFSLRSFSSIQPSFKIPHFTPPHFSRTFSSDPVLQPNDSDNNHVVISDIFSKPTQNDVVTSLLDSNRVSINHDSVIQILGKLDSNADVARRFFNWVLETSPWRLSSKSYNAMLSVLGTNGLVNEFWDLVGVMKKKGFGVSNGVKVKMLDIFEKGGLVDDVLKLNALFESGSIDNSIEKKCLRVCRIVRRNVWDDDVENQIKELNVEWSGNAVKLVLKGLGSETSKALIFFRWLEESGVFKHDGWTYNAMARVLGREDSIDRFWKLLGDMRDARFDLEDKTFAIVLGRFYKRKMIKEAVELYEFAMASKNKPSRDICTIILKKIVVSKELDLDLFSRVLKVFTESGNVLTDSMVNAVLKSLTSVGKMGQWNKVLKVMEGYMLGARGNLQGKIAYRLSAAGYKDEASEFIGNIEASGSIPEHKTWESLVEGHCVAGNLDKAFASFKEMIEKEGVASAGLTFDVLMNSYCQLNKAIDAYKILNEMVNEKELKPRHSTYKLIVTKLLVQGGFADALNILGLMRSHGFPPFTDPLFEHISKSGSADDAILFVKAMTSHDFPSTSVFLRMFNAFFKHGRHDEAQNFLSKCPGHIRNNVDVLNLFFSMHSKDAASSGMLAA